MFLKIYNGHESDSNFFKMWHTIPEFSPLHYDLFVLLFLRVFILGDIVNQEEKKVCKQVISRKLLIQLLICKGMYDLFQVPKLP